MRSTSLPVIGPKRILDAGTLKPKIEKHHSGPATSATSKRRTTGQAVRSFGDVEAVGRWVGAQPWADKTKLVVYGSSYGRLHDAHRAHAASRSLRAGVDLFGVANLPTLLKTTSGAEMLKAEFGDPERDADLLAGLSPLRQVDRIVDPLFVYAGASDQRAPKVESDLIVKALRERGLPVEYMVAGNEGHSLSRRENRIALAPAWRGFSDGLSNR